MSGVIECGLRDDSFGRCVWWIFCGPGVSSGFLRWIEWKIFRETRITEWAYFIDKTISSISMIRDFYARVSYFAC